MNRDLALSFGHDAMPKVLTQVQPWAQLLEGLLEAVWLVDAQSLQIVATNQAAEFLTGVSNGLRLGHNVLELACTPEDQMFWHEALQGSVSGLRSETLLQHADGHLICVLRRASLISDGHGGNFWMVVFQDLTEQRRARQEHETLLAELRATLESTADGILVTDLFGRLRAFNQRFSKLWDIPEALVAQRNDQAIHDWMQHSVQDGSRYDTRLQSIFETCETQTSDIIKLQNGKVLERVSLAQKSHDQNVGRVFSFRDLSESLEANQRMERMERNDLLTSLPNRRTLSDRINYAQALVRREGGSFGFLWVNLDRFKQINGCLGQSVGDRVLCEVARRFEGALRAVDTLARLGGDEFGVLVYGADAAGALKTAQRLQDALSEPFQLELLRFTVTCSIGIAMFPLDGMSCDELLLEADRAMHQVKCNGCAGYRLAQPRKNEDLLARMRLDQAMREALRCGHFVLHYQPQLNLLTGKVIGCEALIRWHDPQTGEIAPGSFIPVAEASGFIIAIGTWVLREAVAQAAQWVEMGMQMPVSINVSPLQFQQDDFVASVEAALLSKGLRPALLELELTESILVHDIDDAFVRLQALAKLGVRLAIDDFGTGYSSLAYLKRFPIQRLKIDRSFIQGLPGDKSDEAITNAIIQMGRALGLRVIAEGVETQAQRQFLLAAGCHEFQGFLYAAALAPAQFCERLRAGGLQAPYAELQYVV